MATDTALPRMDTVTEPSPIDEGWHLLAAASLGRPLTPAETEAVRHLAADIALELIFPDLTDAARHEALVALG